VWCMCAVVCLFFGGVWGVVLWCGVRTFFFTGRRCLISFNFLLSAPFTMQLIAVFFL
jgi:multisubunit Na+/H+ antiporter MnhG subunit